MPKEPFTKQQKMCKHLKHQKSRDKHVPLDRAWFVLEGSSMITLGENDTMATQTKSKTMNMRTRLNHMSHVSLKKNT